MQACSLSVAEKKAVAEYLSGKPLGAGQRAERRALHREAGAARQPRGEAAVERLGRRLGELALSAEAGPDRRRRAEPQAEMGVRIPRRHAGVRQPGDRRRPRLRRQRQRHRLRARRRHRLHATGRSRRTAACARAPSVGRAGARDAVYFGDLKANVFALDADDRRSRSGRRQVDTHAFARVTGAPTLADGKLYVPVSSVEEVPAAQPNYECCTFRGSVVALEAATGEQIWKSYTITGSADSSSARTRRARRSGGRPARRCGARRRSIAQTRRALHRHRQLVHRPGGEDERLGDRDGSEDRQDSLVEPGDRRRRVPRRLPSGQRELSEGARPGLRLRQRADPAHAAGRQARSS